MSESKLHELFTQVGSSEYAGKEYPELRLSCLGSWSLDVHGRDGITALAINSTLDYCLFKAQKYIDGAKT